MARRRKPAARPKARKPAVRKPAARKPARRKPAAKKAAPKARKPADRAKKPTAKAPARKAPSKKEVTGSARQRKGSEASKKRAGKGPGKEGGKVYIGGSKTFNEKTGRHERPDGTPMKRKNARMNRSRKGPRKSGPGDMPVPKYPGKDKGGPVKPAAKKGGSRRKPAANKTQSSSGPVSFSQGSSTVGKPGGLYDQKAQGSVQAFGSVGSDQSDAGEKVTFATETTAANRQDKQWKSYDVDRSNLKMDASQLYRPGQNQVRYGRDPFGKDR